MNLANPRGDSIDRYREAKRSASIEDVQIVSGITPVDLSSGAVDRGQGAFDLQSHGAGNRAIATRAHRQVLQISFYRRFEIWDVGDHRPIRDRFDMKTARKSQDRLLRQFQRIN